MLFQKCFRLAFRSNLHRKMIHRNWWWTQLILGADQTSFIQRDTLSSRRRPIMKTHAPLKAQVFLWIEIFKSNHEVPAHDQHLSASNRQVYPRSAEDQSLHLHKRVEKQQNSRYHWGTVWHKLKSTYLLDLHFWTNGEILHKRTHWMLHSSRLLDPKQP